MVLINSEHFLNLTNPNPFLSARLDTLLYFYSTLPQVLAAIVALTGAFAIFKMNGIKNDLNARIQIVVEILSKNDLQELLMTFFDERDIWEYQESFKTQQVALNRKDIIRLTDRFIKELKEKKPPLTKKADQTELDYRINGLVLNLFHYSSVINSVGNQMNLFLRRTGFTFTFGGISIAVLLTLFMFLPYMLLNTSAYWWILIIGLFLTVSTITLILVYIFDSLAEKKIITKQQRKITRKLKRSQNKRSFFDFLDNLFHRDSS